MRIRMENYMEPAHRVDQFHERQANPCLLMQVPQADRSI